MAIAPTRRAPGPGKSDPLVGLRDHQCLSCEAPAPMTLAALRTRALRRHRVALRQGVRRDASGVRGPAGWAIHRPRPWPQASAQRLQGGWRAAPPRPVQEWPGGTLQGGPAPTGAPFGHVSVPPLLSLPEERAAGRRRRLGVRRRHGSAPVAYGLGLSRHARRGLERPCRDQRTAGTCLVRGVPRGAGRVTCEPHGRPHGVGVPAAAP